MTIDPRFADTDALIKYAMDQFRAERQERFVHAGGRGMRTHGPGEKVLLLPNGQTVKVSVDDSGVATQIEEDEHLHAIVRPHPVKASAVVVPATAASTAHVRPRPIKTSFVPRRTT